MNYLKKPKNLFYFFSLLIFIFLLLSLSVNNSGISTSRDKQNSDEKKALPLSDLPLSEMKVRITSRGYSAEFRLYETRAAKEFYAQLPLELQLDNFRDAQWMFYPPKRLSVTSKEAYHDGKKGELSYYAPWGDVFMLYKDFYAGDEMHRLGINISGKDLIEKMSGKAIIEKIR